MGLVLAKEILFILFGPDAVGPYRPALRDWDGVRLGGGRMGMGQLLYQSQYHCRQTCRHSEQGNDCFRRMLDARDCKAKNGQIASHPG